MATIAVRKAALDNLNAKRRYLLNYVLDLLSLGDPALFTDGAVQWYVWDDPRITLRDIAVFGALVANWSAIPTAYDPTVDDAGTVRSKIRDFIKSVIVHPDNVTIKDGDDPFAVVLAAQKAPALLFSGQSVPDGWSSVTS